MIRRASLLLIGSVLSSLALAGCGGSDGARSAAPASGDGDGARASVSAGVTDGRTGAAVNATSAGRAHELSRGGASDPSDRPRAGRRDGVGAGEACADSDLTPTAETLARVEAATRCLLNAERADRGLPALTDNEKLARAALGHAQDMVEHTYFAHEGRDGSGIKDRIGATGYIPTNQRWSIGENLAWGTGALATPKAIVNAWMNSDGHRANILHTGYREMGFGIVAGNPSKANGFGATYANEFGAVGAADAPRTDDEPADAEEASAPAPTRPRTQRAVSRKRSSCAKISASKARASRRSGKQRKACAAKARAARARAARARAASRRS